MKIDSISYERRASDGSYGNRALRASATLDEQDDPAQAALSLCAFVRTHLEQEVRAEEEQRLADAQRHREELARQRTARMEELAQQQADDTEDDTIPFDDDEEEGDDDE